MLMTYVNKPYYYFDSMSNCISKIINSYLIWVLLLPTTFFAYSVSYTFLFVSLDFHLNVSHICIILLFYDYAFNARQDNKTPN